jgi:hypothetical protein
MDFWQEAEVAVDFYGNPVIGTGSCSLHGSVYLIRSPYSSNPDCIWCYHVEMVFMGVNDCK